ncbi:amino acid adenylation domain-containing protein [Larkinella sp. GY13]|uniref:amino acid adenylation domain-containing protein n=1 Tax=Larkinella sp. GY13 TaxID=3453720 RepID=UPI003EEACAFB
MSILGQHGLLVKGVISTDPQVRKYCTESGLTCIDATAPFVSILESEPFDYLVSISNGYILSKEILQLPRLHTINYHDGPLPAYAGVHATFWALVNGETTHGITWHLVNEGIDTGPILKQSLVTIVPDETSISLNKKCYAAAVAAFRELVEEMRLGPLPSFSQDLTQRTYYGLKKRPHTFIDWTHSTSQVINLHRALNFGFHPNPFGYLKIRINNDVLFVTDLSEVSESADHRPYSPGTVAFLKSDVLVITTGQGLLGIRALTTRAGKGIALPEFYSMRGLAAGQQLGQSEKSLELYYQWEDLCSPHQAYWNEKINRFSPTSIGVSTPVQITKSLEKAVDYRKADLSSAVETALTKLEGTNQTDQLLTAFLIVVARLNDEHAIHVGYSGPISRQIAFETADLFVDCLPFSIDFDLESDFAKSVAATQHEQATTIKHRSFARDWLLTQPALQAKAKLFNESTFPIVIYQTARPDEQPLYPNALTLILSDTGPCKIVYNPAVWTDAQVADLINRWEVVLERVVHQPSQPLKAISLLSTAEQQRVLKDWNVANVPYPCDQTIVELFEAQVKENPLNEALCCGGNSITYGELNQRANQLAWHLHHQGVRPETLVGICLERSVEMVIGLLGVLKAGGGYVPLDPAYPATRLEKLRAQTGVQIIVTQQKWIVRFATEGIAFVVLDQPILSWTSEADSNLALPASIDQLAYVLFTSGSTGHPKSVAIPHRGIIRLVKEPNYAQFDSTTVMLGLAPLAFDASTFELWATLANGGRLILMTDQQPTLHAIKDAIQTHLVNTVFFTTALFNVLVDSDVSGLTTLSQLLTGGEAASAQHLRRAQQQLPLCTISNVYGPTESTTFASFYSLPPAQEDIPNVPIGWPLTNTQLYIVDSFLHVVPVGIAGELIIGGDGLAREYVFQPELTKEKFIPDPFSQKPGRRLYRTGDLARYRNDGAIEFIGRLDDQVKVRGFRIEPGEIEYALRQHPAVGEAFITLTDSPSGQKELAAYLVPIPDCQLATEEVRQFLQTRLPKHLIPAAILPVEALPLTANGKVAKNLLPPAIVRSGNGAHEELTGTEQALMSLWVEVLKNADLGSEDNFFDLGGNSLLAMQLAARIHQRFNRQLSVKDVFDYPTLRRLSLHLDQLPKDHPMAIDGPKPAHEQRPPGGIPLSYAQNRLWIIHQMHELRGTYNVQIILKIEGPLNVPALEKSLAEIVRRHAVLRTSFSHSNGVPFQQPTTDFSLPFQVIELNENEANSTEVWSHWLQQEAYLPFHLEHGPLIRFRVVHLNPDSWMLLLVFHHLVYDGWSTRVFAHELSQLYTSFVRNGPVTLPPLAIQYEDYARAQPKRLAPLRVERERAYWKNRLTGAPIRVALPFDKPAPAIQSFEGADYSFPLSDELWQQLRGSVQEPGTTIYLRLLTAFSVWLAQVTQSSDLVVGVPIAGRNQANVVDTIGFFVNTLALRIGVSADWTFRQLLRQVREWSLEAYDHQDLPFEQVVEALKLPRTLAYAPLVQVLFDYQEDYTKDWKLDELAIDMLFLEQKVAKFDLHVSFRETKAARLVTFNYRTDLFSESAIVAMAGGFIRVLKAIVAEPDQRLGILLGQGPEQRLPSAVDLPVPDNVAPHPDSLSHSQPLDGPMATLLQSIWSWLLEIPVIDLDDDFFDIGGHSLLAFQMIAELQRKTGLLIPVGSVFANPTIRKLATHLASVRADLVWESLVAVKPQGNKPPLFLMHPVSGDVGYVFQLASHLPNNQPVYALRAVGLDGISDPLDSIEAMAAYYVDLILEKQLDGPYALGGFSLGGIIAFEMAQRLQQMGKEVCLLAIIDSYPVNPSRDNGNQVPITQLLQYYYDVWRSLPKRPRLLYRMVRKKIPFLGGYVLNRFWRSIHHKAPKADGADPKTAENPLVTINQQAYSRYTFKPHNGKIIFLRAVGNDNPTDTYKQISFGWSRLALGGVDVHSIPGDHYSLFKHDETISKIARILTSYLPA